MSVIKMTDLDLAGKRVFIRADLNVPVKDLVDASSGHAVQRQLRDVHKRNQL